MTDRPKSVPPDRFEPVVEYLEAVDQRVRLIDEKMGTVELAQVVLESLMAGSARAAGTVDPAKRGRLADVIARGITDEAMDQAYLRQLTEVVAGLENADVGILCSLHPSYQANALWIEAQQALLGRRVQDLGFGMGASPDQPLADVARARLISRGLVALGRKNSMICLPDGNFRVQALELTQAGLDVLRQLGRV